MMRRIPALLTSKSGHYRKSSKTMTSPDLTIFFSEEVADWDNYLTTWFKNNSDESIVIAHEAIEDLGFPLSPTAIRNFANARVVLLILSPAFLEFAGLNSRNTFEVGSLLKPKWTVAMLCGVKEEDVTSIHKEAFVSYDRWLHLIAKHRDSIMVNNMVKKVQNLLSLSREKEHVMKPGFKFVPLKVHEGKGKVYIIFKKPIDDESKKIKIYLDINGMKSVPVKRINAYNCQFHVPDNCMTTVRLLNVHVYHGDDLMGVRQIKCESKMGELCSVLSAANSPYEFMCTTLGMASRHDVDEYMAKIFKELMPPSGLPFFQTPDSMKWRKSKDEIPTLLHFAAQYGMSQLTREILHCPFSRSACFIKNAKDLSPVQIACHHAHHDVATIITEFQRMVECSVKVKASSDVAAIPSFTERAQKAVTEGYDFPPPNPNPVSPSSQKTCSSPLQMKQGYLKMSSSLSRESSPAHFHSVAQEKRLSLDTQGSLDVSFTTDATETDFLKSQTKLIEIIKSYKKGASLLEVERMQNEWKSTYQVSDLEAQQPLEVLRNMYAKAQKSKLNKNKSSSFSELRQFIGSKLRRKDSVGSKSNSTLSHQKDSRTLETDDIMRPMSTLSVTSNTSSSSGSSFDAVSSTGSDSGNHSDNYDDKSRNKLPPSLWNQHKSCSDIHRGNTLLLNNKPPAPPPRPAKSFTKSNNMMETEKSSSRFISVNTNVLTNCEFADVDHCPGRKNSISGFSDSMDCYDIPPVPRPHRLNSISSNSSFLSSENFDYDLVPPPLPLSNKPKCTCSPRSSHTNESAQLYDVPISSLSLVADYDFPKLCNEHAKPDLLDVFTKTKILRNNNHLATFDAGTGAEKIPTYASTIKSNSAMKNSSETISEMKSHYCNIFLEDLQDSDNIPDEFAPAPPILNDTEEEHYKMVGIPVPIEVPD